MKPMTHFTTIANIVIAVHLAMQGAGVSGFCTKVVDKINVCIIKPWSVFQLLQFQYEYDIVHPQA